MREVLRAAGFGYAFLGRHAGALAILAAWRIAVVLALLLAMDHFAPARAADLLAETQVAGKYLALGLARTLLYAATLSPVALAWHRAAAGREALARWYVPTFTRGTARYFLTISGLALAAAALLSLVLFAGNALGTLVAEYLQLWRGPLSKFTFLAGTAVVLWVLARLAPLLPKVALENDRTSLRLTLVSSRRRVAALLFLMFACIAPAPVAMRIAAHYIGEFAPSRALLAKALAELERFMVIGNHLTGMILRRGQARLAGRCGASANSRNTATAQKSPAFGGPNRPTGFVAALARYPVS
ncbi:MAG: hypothetical protein Q8P46_14320, partial [Hyphomicrobiales bacterium]|nr:hypothetical protein [Hyphomicrobiales bacterium]